MALRRCAGFKRYALSIQYHGATHLGMAYQGDGKGENCIVSDTGTDLRGIRSVEGRIRLALDCLVGQDNYENFQVSSRTDRGVHALMNTCHVDIRPRKWRDVDDDAGKVDANVASNDSSWDAQRLRQGLNYYIRTQAKNDIAFADTTNTSTLKRKRNIYNSHSILREFDQPDMPQHPLSLYRQALENSVRVLNVVPAPQTAPNKFYTGKPDCTEPAEIDWNIRFTATSRTYCYRILHMSGNVERDLFVPFEFDRSWRIVGDDEPLDVDAMNTAAKVLIGTHDFSSFRGKDCQRLSPVVTLNGIEISSGPYSQLGHDVQGATESPVRLYTIRITGESFVYRQVRNIVGCLVIVGQGKMKPSEVENILQKRERRLAPAMAPAHGLFLTNVTHWGLDL